MQTINRIKFSLCSMVLSIGLVSPVFAATFTVINTNDSNTGSLRQAIMDANDNPGADNIIFNIAGVGPFIIQPQTPLPAITDPVSIDGYTQQGSSQANFTSPAVLKIVIDGSSNLLGPAAGLTLSTHGNSIKGLVIHSFKSLTNTFTVGMGLLLTAGSNNNTISGNYFGTDVTGTQYKPNGIAGVFINSSDNNIIGGVNPADRNIIAGTSLTSVIAPVLNVSTPIGGQIVIFNSSSNNTIKGNYIGLDPNGTITINPSYPNSPATLPRGVLISVDSNFASAMTQPNPPLAGHNNIIEYNVISGNFDGVLLFAGPFKNIIRNNLFGTDPSGTVLIGNASSAVSVSTTRENLIQDNVMAGSRVNPMINVLRNFNNLSPYFNTTKNKIENNIIGTDRTKTKNFGASHIGILLQLGANNNLLKNNVITNNSRQGVVIQDNTPPIGTASGNTIVYNSIYNNSLIGIDLGNNTITANDVSDADNGANNLQNFPILAGQRSFLNPALMQVRGSLDSKANQVYLIQIFSSNTADVSGHGEGQLFIGEMIVMTDSVGHVDFHLPAIVNVPVGNIVSATATDLVTGDTSEFGPSVNLDAKGNPTAYENAAGAAGGDTAMGGASLEIDEQAISDS